ncbi:MAG: InlB B-repeat-containing protein [Oscillospiraceae bacterium]|nr:InlB B-repeat-containing protein [Oscillospiraceae bacterium]
MNRLRHILSVLLVCLLICSMSVTAFAAGEQGGNTTLTVNVPAVVAYDANGGSGTMEADPVAVGTEFTLPQCGFTAPAGKQFKCWEIGSETYDPGEKITVDSHVTVKAIWEKAPSKAAGENTPAGGTGGAPHTGDDSRLPVWVALLAVSSISVVLIRGSRKRRTNEMPESR